MDCSQEISSELVVTGRDAPEVLEPAEAAFDDISPFVEALAEAVEGYPVGFVWNDGFGAAIDDFSAEVVAIVTLVANEG